MNNLPGVNETLALLDSLKSTVRDFAAREEKLEGEYRARSAAASNVLAARNQAQESANAAQQINATDALEKDIQQHESWYERRKERIHEAHTAANRQAMDKIARFDTEWKDRTQQGVQAAEDRRDEELAARENFQQNLDLTRDQLQQTETSARSAFRGYDRFRRLLNAAPPGPETQLPSAANIFAEFQILHAKTAAGLERFAKFPLPRLFRLLPVWLLAALFLGIAAADPVLAHFGRNVVSHLEAGLALVALLVVVTIHFLGGRAAAPLAAAIAADIAQMRRLLAAGGDRSGGQLESEPERIKNEFETRKQAINQEWRHAVRDINQARNTSSNEVTARASRVMQKNEQRHRLVLGRIQQRHAAAATLLKEEIAAQTVQITAMHQAGLAQIEADHQQRWQGLVADWESNVQPLCTRLRAASDTAEKLSPPWNAPAWKNWTPPATFQNAVKFAQLEAGLEQFLGPLPKDPRLKWPGPTVISAPLSLVFPAQGSILFETGRTSGDEAFGAINNIIFRLLATTPPGKLNFTIFDPVGLGQNFSALMHLADFEAGGINSRIWTQTAQFEEKLAELNEHMEKVIQMYLRNEYATIEEYNAQAGSVAEKYHFLVIASFPVNFSDTASRRLRNIAANGARCGVFILMHWDQRSALPADFVPDELRKNSVDLVRTDRAFELAHGACQGLRLVFDSPPPAEFATAFLQQVGQGSKDASRVEVPFTEVAPPESEIWTEETTALLRVPIGRSGATKLQYLEVGSGTRQHALIAGKTGSGKSSLFHVIITNLALRCPPEQVEFYLVDFKKGVEFKCYGGRRLPHARVVAIESDREFGLSVLQRVDEELRRRGDLFRKLGAQDLPGYKRAGGTEPVPRTLLIIDEFQEFFTEEDRISQDAAVLLDRIVRQGRAFGIHVLLGSQTLGGAYTLARATIGQMVIRIALQCNEADAYLIMDQDNPAPRLLSRPGEGIYNDAAGALAGNSPFQAVWLSDTVRDQYLEKIRDRADATPDQYPGPIVFEGNAPADVLENFPLRTALQKVTDQIPAQAGAWLGAPNSIKGPTEAVFRRQSGGNLLVVGQSAERTTTILGVALVSLAVQFPKNGSRFVVLDSTSPEFPQRVFLERIIKALPHEITLAGNGNLPEVMGGLAEELKRRAENESSGPEIFVLVNGLQNFKRLRQEDEFSFSSSDPGAAPNPAATLMSLLTEGPPRGIHVIVACDTYNNVNRFLGRKALSEFEMRVVFQMSASDSASLIDAPAAATLGLHRALFYNDREGSLETFRPYAQPDSGWIENLAQQPAFRR